jgi:hypothetical protein
MIACKCPKCARAFNVPEARRADVISCPHCGRQLRLPAPRPAGAASAPRPAAPPDGARPQQPARVPDLDVGPPKLGPAETDSSSPVFKLRDEPNLPPADASEPVPVADVSDEDEPDPAPGPRRRRRRRRRKSGQLSRFAIGLTVYLVGLGVAAFIALVLTGLSLLLPSLVLLLVGYGVVLVLVGVVWLYALAHEDGWELISRPEFSGPRLALGLFLGLWTTIALLVILVTAVMYLATNPERAWRPGLVTVLGVLTLVLGLFLLYNLPGA